MNRRMNRRVWSRVSLLLMVAGVGAGVPVSSAEPPATAANASQPSAAARPAKAGSPLDPIKALAGEWEMTDDEGKTILAAVYRVTGGGSAVCETMFPGAPHEMVNMYHLDGPDTVVITHYCAVGNQPRMRCKPGSDAKTFDFRLSDPMKDVTNLSSPDGMYMGSLLLTIEDADHIQQDWIHFDKGKEGGKTEITLTRRRPANAVKP